MNINSLLNNLKNSNEWHLLSMENDIENILSKLNKSYKNFTNFMDVLYKTNNIHQKDPQIIQQIILIARFPKYFLSSKLSEYEYNLHEKALEVLTILRGNEINFSQLSKKIFTFSILYKDWESKDKDMQKDLICELFYRYSKFLENITKLNIDQNTKQIYIKNINMFLNKILRILKLLETNWKKLLYNYKIKDIVYNEQSHKNMEKYLENIFWENINLEINIKKNFKIVNYLINDYKDLLKNTTVDTSVLNNYTEIKDKEDIEILLNILVDINKSVDSYFNYSLLNNKNIVQKFSIIFDRLKKLFG